MKRFLPVLIIICMSLSGCGWFSGEYHSVTPHHNTTDDRSDWAASAVNYAQLRSALQDMVHDGIEKRLIHVSGYDADKLEQGMDNAILYIQNTDPIGAYAVEQIEYSIGTSSAVPAVAVDVTYRHSASELRQIQTVATMEEVAERIGRSLSRYDARLVLLVNQYSKVDLMQLAEDYGAEHPDAVMEIPTVTETTYPSSGSIRVLEIKFTYQNSRDDLRQMQQQVSPVFSAAELYVRGNDTDYRKFSQLYGFLMERFGEYQIKTSITPAYSLLRHGVGDSEAFAVVYAQMCRRAGLDCQTVTGTRDGAPWYWNIVCSGGYYYHVDLLAAPGGMQLLTDAQMENYVWDYSAYPACTGEPENQEEGEPEPPETSVPETAPSETVQPETTPSDPTVPETAPQESTENFENSEN